LEFRPVSPNQRSVTAREQKYMGSHYDYAKGAGAGALVAERAGSSFVFERRWSKRPWPLADKYGYSATDAETALS
jgi:glutathione S-transferase